MSRLSLLSMTAVALGAAVCPRPGVAQQEQDSLRLAETQSPVEVPPQLNRHNIDDHVSGPVRRDSGKTFHTLPPAVEDRAPLQPRLSRAPHQSLPNQTIFRDLRGQTTVEAIRLTNGIQLDGVLDEPVYRTSSAVTGFIQLMPDEGAPATETTEAWIMFDSTNIYVGARIWDSVPPGAGWQTK